MKASVKFRDEQNPLLRAKIPISVLGLPFLSGITAGESKELSLNLGTHFESGPCFKVSYRPNDSWNPFTLVLKTGIGSFGSPISAPMTISTEFSLLGRGNPTFFLRLKPQMGDFSIKKNASSAIVLPTESPVFGRKPKAFAGDHDADGEGPVDGGETPKESGVFGCALNGGDYSAEKRNGFAAPGFHTGRGVDGLFSGVEVNARSVLPLKHRLQLKFRWGVRFPAELRDMFRDGRRRNPTAEFSFKKIPLLVINKISFEHVAEEVTGKSGGLSSSSDVSDTCQSFKRQLEFLRAENGMLRKAVEEVRSEISNSPIESGKPNREKQKSDRKSASGKKDRRNDEKPPEFGAFAGKALEDDAINEELKKALMSANGAGK